MATKIVSGSIVGERRFLKIGEDLYEDVPEGVWNDVLNATEWPFERPAGRITAFRRHLKEGVRIYANSERLMVAGPGR